jgi:hypothetical protein
VYIYREGDNMGIIYKETVRYKRYSFLRSIIVLFLFIVTMNLLVNSVHYSSRYDIAIEIILLAGGVLAAYVLKVGFDMAYTHRICYRYKLIDKELIFERTFGSSDKVILSVNAKDIELLMPLSEAKETKGVDRIYKFLCGSQNNNIYCCVVNNNGQKIKFYFQPSDELVKKIKLVMDIEKKPLD